jgi:MFS family permease
MKYPFAVVARRYFKAFKSQAVCVEINRGQETQEVVNMNTKNDQGAIRTSLRITVYAWVIGLFVAFLAGYVVMNTALWPLGCGVALKRALISGVTLGSLSAALVGLCGLLAGAKLGRNFSYPFTLCLGIFGSLLLISLLTPVFTEASTGVRGWRIQVGLIWFVGIVLAVIAGAVLAMCTRGYRRWSRAGAAVGTVAMLLIPLTSYYPDGRMQEGLIWFMGIVLAVIAGVVLASVVLAMCIRGSRRWSRAGAAAGTVAMLLIGGYLMHMKFGGYLMHIVLGRIVAGREAWRFLIWTLLFTACGGALGAVVGAFDDSLAKPSDAKGITSSQ